MNKKRVTQSLTSSNKNYAVSQIEKVFEQKNNCFNLVFDQYNSNCCELHKVNKKNVIKNMISSFIDITNCKTTHEIKKKLKFGRNGSRIDDSNNKDYKKLLDYMKSNGLGDVNLEHCYLGGNNGGRLFYYIVKKHFCVLLITTSKFGK